MDALRLLGRGLRRGIAPVALVAIRGRRVLATAAVCLLLPGVAARHLAAVKAWSRSFVWLYEEPTTVDLLLKLPRIPLEERAKARLTEAEIDAIFAALDTGVFEHARDAAMLAVYLSTGLRFKAVLEMGDDLDGVSGEFAVVEKGAKHRPVRMSPRALKLTRRYRTLRPGTGSGRLWMTALGALLTYWGGQSVFRRVRWRSGVTRLHAHLCRHTFGQVALAMSRKAAFATHSPRAKSTPPARRLAGRQGCTPTGRAASAAGAERGRRPGRPRVD
jgi:site-specific recombinase XerD